MTAILDYGMGNLRSVQRAVAALGLQSHIQTSIGNAERLIIPGVGAFGAAMERIGPLKQEIRAFAAAGNPVLGICLGQQLLFSESEEFGRYEGLDLIPGLVKYFDLPTPFKVPHMGWNTVTLTSNSPWADVNFGGHTSVDEQDVYYVHSLYTECEDEAHVAGTTDYGQSFAGMVAKGNVWGTQFHPEKSGKVGLEILRRFLTCS